MATHQLIGLVLIVIGFIDLLAIPKMMDAAWKKAKHPPAWAESLNMIVRLIGIVFIFFGLSSYFFGQPG